MKKFSYVLLTVFVFATMLLTACAGVSAAPTAPQASVGGGKPRASLTKIEGVIEAIDGDQWTVNGQTYTVPAEVAAANQFAVGDSVEIEFTSTADGNSTAVSVEQSSSTEDDAANDNSTADDVDDDTADDTEDDSSADEDSASDDSADTDESVSADEDEDSDDSADDSSEDHSDDQDGGSDDSDSGDDD